MLNEICKKRPDRKGLIMRDGPDRCAVTAPFTAWPGAVWFNAK